MQFSLRARMLTSFCSIAVVSTALMLILQHRSLSTDLETRAHQRFDESCAAVERLIDHYLGLSQSRYEAIAARPYVRAIFESGDVPTIADLASTLHKKHAVPRLAFFDQQGQVVAGAGDDRLDEQALAEAGSRLIVFERKPFAVVSVPVRGGALEIGRLLVVESLPEAELASWTAISAARVFFGSNEGGAAGHRRRMLRDLGAWKLYVEAPRISTADQEALSSSRDNLFLAGAVALAVACAAGLALSRGLVRPIQELGRAAERIGDGDFTVKLESSRGDEIGLVARAFTLMTTNLGNAIVGVSESADHVESAANRISTLTVGMAAASVDQARETSETSATMDRICAQVEDVAQAASDSARVLEQSTHGSSAAVGDLGKISEALNENTRVLSEHVEDLSSAMTASAAQIARSSNILTENSTASTAAIDEVVRATTMVDGYAEKSSEMSRRVVDIAEHGRQTVQSSADGMDLIQRETRSAEQSISRLVERVGEISSIIDLIENIADEAKLLALNGTIVAAQVGKEGRAFSVVAEQMGTLANRVFSETEKIIEAIHATERESRDALLATRRSAESVIEGVKRAAEAGTSLDSITEAVRENSRYMGDVLGATKSQSQASGQALELLEGTRSEVEQIRVACSEQAKIAEGVSQDCVALRGAAHEVLRATAGQSDQSARIIEIVDTVRSEVKSNSRSLSEQTVAFAEAKKRLESVNECAGANQESVDQVGTAVHELLQLAERLRAEIQRLRC